MENNIKEESKDIPVEEVKEEVKKEVKEEVKEEVKKEVKKSTLSSIFISDDDDCVVNVKYYKSQGKLMVEGVDDDDFDSSKDCEELSITFRYPTQGDCKIIDAHARNLTSGGDEVSARDFLNLEFARFMTLIKKWSVPEKLSNENILKLHPKIVKAFVFRLRKEMQMDGII